MWISIGLTSYFFCSFMSQQKLVSTSFLFTKKVTFLLVISNHKRYIYWWYRFCRENFKNLTCHKLHLSVIHSSLMVGGRYGLECIECNKSGKDNTYKKTWPQRIYCAYPKHHSLLKVKRLKDNPAKDRPQTL